MKTENEVRTVTTIKLDAEDKKILDKAADVLSYINTEMCSMHATEIEILFDNDNRFDSEFRKNLWDAGKLFELIERLCEIRNCLEIQIEGDYYEGMS